MKIKDNVIKLDCTKGSYAYAIMDNGVTLIDTSLPKKGKAILLELKSYDIDPKDIKRILLTHNDIDHIGNAAFFQEHCGCEIIISEEDYPQVIGTKKRYGIKKSLGSIIKVAVPKTVTCFVNDKIGDISIISTPGHTPGHTCFRYADLLFAGDLMCSRNGNLIMTPNFMNWNKNELVNSLKNLSVEGVEWLCPAHGEPVRVKGSWSEFRKQFDI